MQRMSIWENNCVIHWIDFYAVDSVIQPLNYQALGERRQSGVKILVQGEKTADEI